MADQQELSSEQREKLIAEAAYFRAKERDFKNGDPVIDWLDAEAEVDAEHKHGVKDRLFRRLETRMAIANRRLGDLRDKVAELRQETREEIHEDLEKLEDLRARFEQQIEDIKRKTGQAKQKAKHKAEELWAELIDALHRFGLR